MIRSLDYIQAIGKRMKEIREDSKELSVSVEFGNDITKLKVRGSGETWSTEYVFRDNIPVESLQKIIEEFSAVQKMVLIVPRIIYDSSTNIALADAILNMVAEDGTKKYDLSIVTYGPHGDLLTGWNGSK